MRPNGAECGPIPDTIAPMLAMARDHHDRSIFTEEQVTALEAGDAVRDELGERFEIHAFFAGKSGERRAILARWNGKYGSWHYQIASDRDLHTRFTRAP